VLDIGQGSREGSFLFLTWPLGSLKLNHSTPWEGSGVKNRCDEFQRLETDNFRTTNLGVVLAESGLRPAESLLNNRSRRHVLRLMSLPKGNKAKSLPGCNTAMGQRMVHFSEYSGRMEEIYLPEDGPMELRARTSIADAEWAE